MLGKPEPIKKFVGTPSNHEALLRIYLYHTLGELPEPKFTHGFC